MHRLLTTDRHVAVDALRAGGLVALPTETVYGLAARADSAPAVSRIYEAKGRPTSHPVIVHVASAEQAERWARDVPRWVRPLIDRCWPGPLTLVLPRAPHVGDYLTGDQDTVALRVPGHPLTHRVLEELELAVAAPSANRFGQVSPTTAGHVLTELAEFLEPGRDLVLDGGACPVGVESTIVDATGGQPRLLRPGSVTAAEIEQITGLALETNAVTGNVRAPGMLDAHYAPRAQVLLADPESAEQVVEQAMANHPGTSIGLIALAATAVAPRPNLQPLLRCTTDAELARGLYQALRSADDQGMSAVVAALPPGDGLAAAVRDRLTRAAAGRRAPSP